MRKTMIGRTVGLCAVCALLAGTASSLAASGGSRVHHTKVHHTANAGSPAHTIGTPDGNAKRTKPGAGPGSGSGGAPADAAQPSAW